MHRVLRVFDEGFMDSLGALIKFCGKPDRKGLLSDTCMWGIHYQNR
jgi:hypothetical protein